MAGIRKTLCATFLKRKGGEGKQSGSVLCGVCAIRAKENEEEWWGKGGLGYVERRGVENKLRTARENKD